MLGYEVAGEVETVGPDVQGVRVGQRVIAPPGSAAKRSWSRSRPAAPAAAETISFEQGAAFCVNYATAYAALIIMGGLRPGNQVLIHAAAGGVGIAATQIARNTGAEIFGTASRAKHEAIQRTASGTRSTTGLRTSQPR